VQEEEKSGSRNVIAAIIALILAIGGGGVFAWLSTRNSIPPDPSASNSAPKPNQDSNPIVIPIPPDGAPITSPSGSPNDLSASTDGYVKFFYIDEITGEEKFKLVPKQSQTPRNAAESQNVLVKRALTRLLASAGKPTDQGKKSSTIPATTKLLSTIVKPTGIYVNLSKEFMEGGGSTSMQARLAQILYTATERNTKGKVWISVEGKRLDVLGGEGIEVKQPLTRKTFQQDFNGSVGEQ
jgi:spore germination protein GerM